MKLLKWCAINLTFLVLLLLGVSGVVGAMNVVGFFIIAYGALIALALCAPNPAKMKEPYKPAIPRWVDICYDILIVGILAWTAHWLLALVYIHIAISQQVMLDRCKPE